MVIVSPVFLCDRGRLSCFPSLKERKMVHLVCCVFSAICHPFISLLGAWEFRSGAGMTYPQASRNEAYDAGRELSHIATFRYWDR